MNFQVGRWMPCCTRIESLSRLISFGNAPTGAILPFMKKRAVDLEGFWAEQAESIDWFRKWDQVLDWKVPDARWFVGGKLNVCYNCVDRHLSTWRKNRAAIVWEGEPGDERVLTYQDLYREVNQCAAVLQRLGIQEGDRIAIYLGMLPELAIAMLACARLGAPHTVVFGGFSPESLSDRINDCQAKLLITADGAWRKGGGCSPQRQRRRSAEELLDHRECPGRQPHQPGF